MCHVVVLQNGTQATRRATHTRGCTQTCVARTSSLLYGHFPPHVHVHMPFLLDMALGFMGTLPMVGSPMGKAGTGLCILSAQLHNHRPAPHQHHAHHQPNHRHPPDRSLLCVTSLPQSVGGGIVWVSRGKGDGEEGKRGRGRRGEGSGRSLSPEPQRAGRALTSTWRRYSHSSSCTSTRSSRGR